MPEDPIVICDEPDRERDIVEKFVVANRETSITKIKAVKRAPVLR